MTLAAFAETRLDLGYDYGMTGGPEWSTTVAMTRAGYEARNANWAEERGRWDAGQRNIDQDKLEYLFAFFNARRGRAQGFRFKDWLDFQAADQALSPDGSPTVQLTKTYSDGGVDYTKPITKPVAGTVSLTRNGSAFTNYTLDTTTGEVTLAADAAASIADVTAAAPAVVTTSSDHGYSTGDAIWITGTGLAEIDGQVWTITGIDSTSFELDGSDTSGTSGASSGDAEKYVQPSEDLAWSGEYDKPARFDTDRWPGSAFLAMDPDRNVAIYDLPSLPIVEVRE